MVDIVVTPANVVRGSGSSMQTGVADEAINAGQVVALDTVTGKYKLASATSPNLDLVQAAGIALNSATANQPLSICTSGKLTLGAVLTAGIGYYVSVTPGGICERAQLVTVGAYVCSLGLSKSTSLIKINIEPSDVQV